MTSRIPWLVLAHLALLLAFPHVAAASGSGSDTLLVKAPKAFLEIFTGPLPWVIGVGGCAVVGWQAWRGASLEELLPRAVGVLLGSALMSGAPKIMDLVGVSGASIDTASAIVEPLPHPQTDDDLGPAFSARKG